MSAKLGAIGALIATRVWLFYSEDLTKNLNLIYIALIIIMSFTLFC